MVLHDFTLSFYWHPKLMENIENHDSARGINNGNQFIDGMVWCLSLMCEVIARSRRSLCPMLDVWVEQLEREACLEASANFESIL